MKTMPFDRIAARDDEGEASRLAALRGYHLQDSGPDSLLDPVARSAASICSTPVAAINFVDADRVWTKAAFGLSQEMRNTPRSAAFCNAAVRSSGITEVGDAWLHEGSKPRGFPPLRFYAAAPLKAPGGEAVGTLCVMDTRARELSADQRESLEGLADVTMAIVESRSPANRLGALIESSPDASFFFDPATWRWRHVNESGLKSLGLSAEEAATADPGHYCAAYSADNLSKRLAPLLEGRVERVTLETEHRTPGGESTPVEVAFTAVRKGGDVAVLAFAHDIADRLGLADERKQRQRFFEMASEIFLILRSDGRVLQTNHRMSEALGFAAEAINARPLLAFIEPAERPRAAATLRRCAASGETVDAQFGFVRADGTRRRLALSGRSDGAGRVYLVGRDVTEWQAAERRLRLLEKAFEASENPFIVADLAEPGGIVEYVNPAFEKVTGYTAAEAVGRNCSFLQGSDREQPEIAEIRRALAARQACQVTLRNYRKDGTLFYNDLHLSPVPDDDGVVTHYVGLQYDVTQLKSQQERIRRLDRIHALVGAVGRAIVRGHTEQSLLLQDVCDTAVGYGGFALVWAGLVDSATGELRPSASCGAHAAAIRSLVLSRDANIEAGGGFGGAALRSTMPVVCNDVRSAVIAEVWRRRALASGIAAFAYLPLVREGRAVGLVAFHSSEAATFDEEELRLLQGIVTEVAFALESIDQAQRIEYLASHDPLTGLPDVHALEARIDSMLRGSGSAAQARVAVAMVDIERLKMLNDTFGRRAGDALLCELAARLRELGGEEVQVSRARAGSFIVSAAGMESIEAVRQWVRTQILQSVATPFGVEGVERYVSARCGVAWSPDDGGDAATLIAHAESALLQAKKRAERVVFYSADMSAHVAQTLSVENELRRAVEGGEFVLFYQPKVELRSGELCGFEALLRWHHPERGLVTPGQFIGVLEDTGLVAELAPWLIAQALADAKTLNRGRAKPLRVAINVSQVQMRRSDFIETVAAQLGDADPSDCSLDIEITESLLIENTEMAIEKLRRLSELGIRIAIDDFGTGYSSLGYIARLPVNALKIDQSFVRDMASSRQSMAIVSSIVSLARALDKTSIAEGVETVRQRDLLRRIGCDQMQGYLQSRPMPLDAAIDWLAER